MDAKTCLQKLKLIGVLSFSTVDQQGNPQIRCISAIHYDEDSLYFFTARGKKFCQELLENGKVQILAYTRLKEMIRLSANAVPVEQERQDLCIDTIFREHSYLANVYPGGTRKIGIVFEIRNAEIEYFNLGINPIFRETYMLGKEKVAYKGYEIGNECISCGKCTKNCPQRCIETGKPYKIQQSHCLHCGLCAEVCPIGAVRKRGSYESE